MEVFSSPTHPRGPGEECRKKKIKETQSFLCNFATFHFFSVMGQIKDGPRRLWSTDVDTKRRDRTSPPKMKKGPISSTSAKSDPKVLYTCDGFWTTQRPSARAFSIEWFKIHLSMAPYCWAMLKMAWSVGQQSVLTIIFGTICRAFLDVASIYAYTRFVNEVQLILALL